MTTNLIGNRCNNTHNFIVFYEICLFIKKMSGSLEFLNHVYRRTTVVSNCTLNMVIQFVIDLLFVVRSIDCPEIVTHFS